MVPQKKPVMVGTVAGCPVLVEHRGPRLWSVTLNGRRIDTGLSQKAAKRHALQFINDNKGKLNK